MKFSQCYENGNSKCEFYAIYAISPVLFLKIPIAVRRQMYVHVHAGAAPGCLLREGKMPRYWCASTQCCAGGAGGGGGWGTPTHSPPPPRIIIMV